MSEEILKGGERKEEESAQLLFIMANEKATKISDGKKVAQKEERRVGRTEGRRTPTTSDPADSWTDGPRALS